MNEMQSMIREFEAPEKRPSKKKQKTEESDSEPSCDNFEEVDLNQCFEEVLDDKQKEILEQQKSKKIEEENNEREKQEKEKEDSMLNFVRKTNVKASDAPKLELPMKTK